MLKHTEIIEKDLSRYRYLDKTELRIKYFKNVIKSISFFEEMLYKKGFDQMFVEQSPFSSSCYLTINKLSEGKTITLRISDHENQGGFQQHLTDEIISRFGFFCITKQYLELINGW